MSQSVLYGYSVDELTQFFKASSLSDERSDEKFSNGSQFEDTDELRRSVHDFFSKFDDQNKFEDPVFNPLNKLENQWSLLRSSDYQLSDGVSVELFGEISIENVHQGEIGDCYSKN